MWHQYNYCSGKKKETKIVGPKPLARGPLLAQKKIKFGLWLDAYSILMLALGSFWAYFIILFFSFNIYFSSIYLFLNPDSTLIGRSDSRGTTGWRFSTHSECVLRLWQPSDVQLCYVIRVWTCPVDEEDRRTVRDVLKWNQLQVSIHLKAGIRHLERHTVVPRTVIKLHCGRRNIKEWLAVFWLNYRAQTCQERARRRRKTKTIRARCSCVTEVYAVKNKRPLWKTIHENKFYSPT